MIPGQDKIIYNWLVDFKKKDINFFERGQLIQKYLDEQSISQRELARLTQIPHNTLQDWLLWTRLTEKEYSRLKKKGLSDTDIYRMLREGKKIDKQKLMGLEKVDCDLQHCIKKLKPHLNMKESSAKTAVLIHQLEALLKKILLTMELSQKKK